MDLVGAYISELRSANGLTQPALAAQVGIHERTVRNIENAKHEPKPTDLDAVLKLLHGSWAHIAQLMQPGATKELAKRLAQEAFQGNGFTEEQRVLLENLTPEQKAALLAVARQMIQ